MRDGKLGPTSKFLRFNNRTFTVGRWVQPVTSTDLQFSTFAPKCRSFVFNVDNIRVEIPSNLTIQLDTVWNSWTIDLYVQAHLCQKPNVTLLYDQRGEILAGMQTETDCWPVQATKHFTINMFRFFIRILYRGVPGFAIDCPCGVWCRGLTTCLLYVRPLFWKSSLK